MSEFVERLEWLMFEQHLNKKTLAKNVSINATCISHYLLDKRVPTVENLVKLADYFQCSTDYLLGREEKFNLKFKPCPPFREQIEFLKEHFHCSAYSIYSSTENTDGTANSKPAISKSCYYRWINQGRKPSVDNVIKLADHFGCRVDFILGRET